MTAPVSRPRALVTGATGFIGSHVARLAEAAGYETFALVRGASDRARRSAVAVAVRRGDLADETSLDDAVADMDVVFHLAGATRAKSAAAFFDANAEGVARLVRACRRRAPRLRRFVYVSSLAAAGPSVDGRPAVESDPPQPVSVYGRSKLAGEERLRAEAGPLPWTIIRPPMVYGPEDQDVLQLFRAVRSGFLPCLGTGRERYSIVHGEELARGIVACATAAAAVSRTYYLAEPIDYSQEELCAHLSAAVGRRARLLRLPKVLGYLAAAAGSAVKPFRRRPPLLTLDKLPEVLAPGWSCDPSAAARDFGFRTILPLRDGAALTAAWFRAHGML
jgi:nucleoside-diphosphate-sugar epimerase